MRGFFALAAASLLVGGSAGAQALRSSDDYLSAIMKNPCVSGEPREPDGVCPTTAATAKGASLFPPSAALPKATQPRVPRAPAPRPHPSALNDLRITFKLGSADLTPSGRATAENFAEALRKLPRTRFEIAGYTDVSGAPERNRELSAARALSVKAYLVSHGVDEARLETKGYGSEDLAVPSNPTSPANRRVEAHSLN